MEKISTLTGHTFRVLYLAMSPDGASIVTGAGDETLRFWNVFPKCKSSKGVVSNLNGGCNGIGNVIGTGNSTLFLQVSTSAEQFDDDICHHLYSDQTIEYKNLLLNKVIMKTTVIKQSNIRLTVSLNMNKLLNVCYFNLLNSIFILLLTTL